MTEPTSTKREQAVALLSEMLLHRARVAIADVVKAGAEIGVSRRTLQRASSDLGLREIHNGPFGAFWEKPAS